MAEDLGQETLTGGHEPPEAVSSPNTKIHGEPTAGSPMPGVERKEKTEVKEEANPNTE